MTNLEKANEALDGIISSVVRLRKGLHEKPEQADVYHGELAKLEDQLDDIVMAFD